MFKRTEYFFLMLFILLLTACGSNSKNVFEGKGTGFEGASLVVEVGFKENFLDSIKVKSSNESDFTAPAIETLTAAIIERQGTDVDDVAGATITSGAFKEAVQDAITKSGKTLVLNEVKGEDEKKSETVVLNDIETDILVVGAGGAGFSAAISAHEKGANVILIEKTDLVGGNTNYATAGLNAANSKLQKELEIEDSAKLFYDDTMKGGKELNDKELVTVLTENSSDIIDWLIERGVDLSEITATGGQSVTRTHRPAGGKKVGPELIKALSNTAENAKIDVRTSTEAIEILKEDDKVVGVKVKSNDGEYTIKAKAVIITTGGFGANPEMVEQYNPELKGFGSTNSPAIVGDGLKMVEAIGGVLIDMKEIQTHPTVVHNGTAMITEAVRGEGAILVNKNGERFINELETRDVVSKAELSQDGASAFLIFDQEVRDNLSAINGYVKQGFAKEAATLEELADIMSINKENLPKTLESYNGYVEAAEDKDFSRVILPRKLEKGPFYAIEVSPAVHHTMGGIRINKNAEVLGSNGAPIKGLYAAGEVTGGVHGANRIGGNAVSDITIFGKIAGENAVIFVETNK